MENFLIINNKTMSEKITPAEIVAQKIGTACFKKLGTDDISQDKTGYVLHFNVKTSMHYTNVAIKYDLESDFYQLTFANKKEGITLNKFTQYKVLHNEIIDMIELFTGLIIKN